MKHKTLLIAASRTYSSDTLRFHFLKLGIQTLTDKLAIRDLKLKTVRQAVRRQKKKIATIKLLSENYKKRTSYIKTLLFTLLESFGNESRFNYLFG